MRHMLEGLSTWIFRIAAVSVLAFTMLQLVREQSRPAKIDLKDVEYLQQMEDYLKRERACKAAHLNESRPSQQPTSQPFRGVARR